MSVVYLINALVFSLLFQTGDIDKVSFYQEVTKEVGIDFVHFNGMAGDFYLAEIMGPGCAFFDFDNDGDLDVYLVQSAIVGPGRTMADAIFPHKDAKPKDRLLRNEINLGKGLRFTDVTEESGIVSDDYGMGVTAGDVNNDGFVDLYVTVFGKNRLFLNQGNGRFKDVTDVSGTGDTRWSTSAAFVDYDNDGDLDLYVCNYAVLDMKKNPKCYGKSSVRDYCGPDAYPAERDILYRNKGDGTFEDASNKLNGMSLIGAGLGVVTADFNNDGRVDIYVANDGDANWLWLNQGDGRFLDDALMAGVALNRLGAAEASMGVTAGDFDDDGDEDLFMTHLMDETNTLYVNGAGGLFEDQTTKFGLAVSSRSYTGFGTAWVDIDQNGTLDLISLNGRVSNQRGTAEEKHLEAFQERNQIFLNNGQKFQEVNDPVFCGPKEVSRGAAIGDVDNDGDVDLLLTNTAGAARLLLNQSKQRWIGFRLIDQGLKRDMYGARVCLTTVKGKKRWRRVAPDGSYLSSGDPRVLFGLGNGEKVAKVTVVWPDGKKEEREKLAIGRYHEWVKGRVQ